MQFTIELTHQDYTAFEKFAIGRLVARLRSHWVSFVGGLLFWTPFAFGVGSVVMLYRRYPAMTTDLTAALVALALAGAMLWADGAYRRRRIQRALLSLPNSCYGMHQVTADAGGLEVRRAGVSSRYDWSTFSELVETDAAFYLLLDPMRAVTVAKRCFSAAAELDEFRALAQRHRQPALT